MPLSFRMYRVRGGLGDWNHTTLVIDEKDFSLSHLSEREVVAHALWCKLMENERTTWGIQSDKPSATARVLRKLCEKAGPDGVTKVKRHLTMCIVFERLKQMGDD